MGIMWIMYHEEAQTVFEFYGCYWHGMSHSFSRQKQSTASSLFAHAQVVYTDHWQE